MSSSSLHSDFRRRPMFLAVTAAVALLAAGCGRPATETASPGAPETKAGSATLESVEQKASYGIGYNVGSNLARQTDFKPDQSAIIAGLQDALGGEKARLADEELQAAFASLQERAGAAAAKAGETNLTAANAYLEQNRSRPGVKVTDSGLQYEILRSGNGPKPKASDTVEVHYHGTLIDGTVFDSSVERGETIAFPVSNVIPGWVEALQLMSVGDKWKLTIPPGLGYGARAAGKIPPHSALIFEVELIGIK
jgi:FKBP-type peptidyl-prolyl cis-trans isomerase FklB